MIVLRTILVFSIFLFCSASAHSEVKRYFAGNPEDVKPELHGPAFHFQGGGTDVDAAFQWMFDQVRGCTDCGTKLDVVVLTAYGDGGYNEYLLAMKGVDSVETLAISNRADAQLPEVAATIRNAEIIFFGGGDQCNYVSFYKGTPMETAVESVYERGGGIGGTSAGDAIQGEYLYDACAGSTQSHEALANPYHESISFTTNFFHWKYMEGTLTDQHLVERNRIGRTLAFLARLIRDGNTKQILGIAANRETSVMVDKNGLATINGKGPVYFILADHMPEVCEPNKPLTYSNFKLWKVDPGDTFDLKNRPAAGYYTRSVKEGVIDADPYAPTSCVPYTELAAVYAKKDSAKVKLELERVLRMCPYDFEPYQYLDAVDDPKFVRSKAADLRRYLWYSRGERLKYYATLWPLELRITPAEDQGKLREQIAEDIKELQASGRDEIVGRLGELRKINKSDGLQTMELVEIGGVKQWISIRGKSSKNPVILVLHGDHPLMPAGWAFQTPWEDYFTVVQWDRRGVGKNYQYADHEALAPTMTMDRLAQDAEEMVNYIRKRLTKNKIVLLAFNSGNAVGVPVAMKHPQWFYAYVRVQSSEESLPGYSELAPEYSRDDVELQPEALKWAHELLKPDLKPETGLHLKIPVIQFNGGNSFLEEPGPFLDTLVKKVLPLTR